MTCIRIQHLTAIRCRTALSPGRWSREQLFYSKYACQGCHIVDTKTDKGTWSNAYASGSRLNAAWIYHWLKDPQAMRSGTIEPNRNMNDEDAASDAFLMTQKGSGKQEAKK